MPLQVSRNSLQSGIEVLTLSGSLTLGRESQQFEELVIELIGSDRNRIVLDMTGIAFADSAGIGILVGCHGKAGKAGGQLRLAAAAERVRNVLRITKVDSLLRQDATVADSIRAIAETA